MTAVVTDNCELCRFTECVKVCPVACFHGDDKMVYIDSRVCIDCCGCIPVCPVRAIYLDSDLPADKTGWIVLNQERVEVLPLFIGPLDPLPTAAEKRRALGF